MSDDIMQMFHRLELDKKDQDVRIGRIEVRQEGFEDTMREQHRLIHSRIDGLDRVMQRLADAQEKNTELLQGHVEKEDQDRRQLLSRQNATIITVLLGVAGWALVTLIEILKNGNTLPFTP